MSTRQGVSVAIITRNEEHNLDRCLRSVAWVEEVVVVDSESTDRTREIAARHRAAVHVRPWPGFVEQWNFALSLASQPWVLVLAADEWLSEGAAAEIRNALTEPRADAYEMRRLTAFHGGFVKRAWGPDWQLRLFRNGRGRFAGGRVHESVCLDPGLRVERLRGELLHLTYRSVRGYVERMNRYTDLAAETMRDQERGFSVVALLVRPWAAFVKHYLLRRGFLDGVRGLVVSVGAACYVFFKLAKRWEMERGADPEFLAAAGSTPEDPDPGGGEPRP